MAWPSIDPASVMFDGQQPEASDLMRAVLARARSKVMVGLADDAYRGALWSVLRTELGESVTRVSAFALALLEDENLPLDDLAWMIEPARGWPYQLLVDGRQAGRSGAAGKQLPGASRFHSHRPPSVLRRHGLSFASRDGARLRLHVVEDSLEIVGRVDVYRVRTRFGVLRLKVPGAMPASVVRSCVGRTVDAIVDLRPLRGQGWPVVGLEASSVDEGWTLIVDEGSREYRMPWTRE